MIPPALMRYRVGESYSVEQFLYLGRGCANHVVDQAGSAGVELRTAKRVLDFGCGCGRILRWLMSDYPHVEFFGVDVDHEALRWCDKHLPLGHFDQSSFEPPLKYPDAYFDIIYCFSVFTHLDEKRQDLWLQELRRLLRPGGLLFITVHGTNAAKNLDQGSVNTLTSVGFVHRRSKKLRGILPEWYNTTWHSRAYIMKKLSISYADVKYVEMKDGRQDIVLAKAPLGDH